MTKRLKFYAITHDILGDVFWEVFRKGLLDAAERYDVDVEHLRPGRFSPEIQAGLIDSAVHARPDGLISTVPDIAAVDRPLRAAVEAGIPVICVNARDLRQVGQRIPYLFYIGGDDSHAGELAARYIIEHVKPRSVLCVDHYLHEHICHADRWRGFMRACEAAGIQAERLRVPGGDAVACASAVSAHLHDNGEIGAILTLGPPGAQAVLDAMTDIGVNAAPKHLTFDLAQLQIDAIRTGKIMATVDSQQYLQGYLAVQHLWLHRTEGFSLASDIYTGPAIVDLSNLDQAEAGVTRGTR